MASSANSRYAYVHFDTQEAADLAIQTLNGKLLNGKKVDVSKFTPRDQCYTHVYIKNFGEDYDTDQLKATFENFGNIVSAEVMMDASGKCSGHGFVNFDSQKH